MDIKLNKKYELYGTKYQKDEIIPVNKDTGKRLIKLDVAERVNEDTQWLNNRSEPYE